MGQFQTWPKTNKYSLLFSEFSHERHPRLGILYFYWIIKKMSKNLKIRSLFTFCLLLYSIFSFSSFFLTFRLENFLLKINKILWFYVFFFCRKSRENSIKFINLFTISSKLWQTLSFRPSAFAWRDVRRVYENFFWKSSLPFKLFY